MKRRSAILWMTKKIYRRIPALLFLTAVSALSALLGVAFALGTRDIIDGAASGDAALFWRACAIQLGIIAATLAASALSRHLRDRLTAELDRDWKRDVLHGLLHGEYAKVSAYHSGELLNRLNNDVRIVDEGAVNTLPALTGLLVRLFAAMAVLFVLAPKFAALILAAGVVVILLTGLMRRKLKELNKRVSASDGKVSSFLQESLEKLLMVQALDVSSEIERRAGGLMEERFALQRKKKNVSLMANFCVSALSLGAGFAALVWCAFALLNGTMSFGSLTAVIQLVNQLRAPLVNISGIFPQYVAMTASAERLMELDALRGKSVKGSDAEKLYRDLTAIGAENLDFSYDREPIFEKAAFSLPKGSFAVVVGASGAGKSTLLKLLLGVFRPDGGELYAQTAKKKVTLERATRKLFAYVPQGNLLLSGTLRENLTITKPGATAEEIAEALYVSALDDVLVQLPEGMDTYLGEDGAGLSEGQAQRLAIARAVLGGAHVLLLDEATSALDAETEKTVLERIRQLEGRSCIAVTHRSAAEEIADYRLTVTERGIRTEKLEH